MAIFIDAGTAPDRTAAPTLADCLASAPGEGLFVSSPRSRQKPRLFSQGRAQGARFQIWSAVPQQVNSLPST